MTISSPTHQKRVLHVISGDLWAGAEAQAATLLKHLKPLCDVSAVLLNEGELANRLRGYNIPVTVLSEQKLSSWQIFLSLRKHIKQLKPDVIHTHRQKENILGALANSTSVKARCVRTVHGAPEFSGGFKTQLLRKFDNWVGNHFQDVIIAVSDDLKTKLIGTFPEHKIKVVMNGVDVEELKAKAGITEFKKAEPNKKHIGIIGRLVPVKRVDIFLETAALFKKDNHTDYHFHVVGNGPLEAQLKEHATELDINDIVTFHGHRDDVPSYINSLDAVVMCSDHEGMPMVALEALALGTKLVTQLKSLIKALSLPIQDESLISQVTSTGRDTTSSPINVNAIGCANGTFALY
ncbi:glycosyltransferase [Reinekea marina]|uniref:Glycosyltransferase n=1 Tax=Reinekea marina TaxID=1310421 RepID=A0ABV7WQJ8_9GAMM|nr:glycosyltransferase [Reinekea marina]MDN3648167.1 glycosyltransferase [Reinekea marina]